MEAIQNSRPSLLGLAIALIAAAAFCLIVPFFWLGIPSGHDFEFHFNSWLEVVQHWKEHVIYPHWAAAAHYEYGEARFVFYPPISWALGALVGILLPWKLVSGADIWITLTLSGAAMFVLARRWLSRNDALLASVLYVASPYHLVIVYWRSAMAELLASAYLPLLLLFVLRSEEDGRRMVAPLSLIMAAGWLTNVPTAIMMSYSLALLVLWVAISRRSWQILGYGALSAVLGVALAGIYLVPVFHQQHWVNISQVLAPGVRPVDNFLFTTTSDPDHNQFNRLASVIASSEIVIVAGLLFWSRRWRNAMLWQLMLVWGVFCSVLMLRFTLPLWMYLPELRYIQLPWRLLLCLNVAFALGVVMAARRWWLRLAIYLVAFASVVFVWQRVLPPWWDHSGDIQEMVDNQQDAVGNEGTDEYVPLGVDPYDVDQKAPQVQFEGPGSAEIRIEKWQSERRLIFANATSSGKLMLRLFNYPLWKVAVNGQEVRTQSTQDTGQMIVPVAPGENRIQITFVEGWDRLLGAGMVLLALLALVLWSIRSRRFA
jgi:6-pyruvoyl-tetrahydropterin synthase related domain